MNNPTDCLFCKIISGEIPANKLFEDNNILAFEDINPQAPVHTLIIPKKHISTINQISDDDTELIGNLIQTARKIAMEKKLADDGYRLVMNCGEKAGQTVFHIHLHLLAGRNFGWPPG